MMRCDDSDVPEERRDDSDVSEERRDDNDVQEEHRDDSDMQEKLRDDSGVQEEHRDDSDGPEEHRDAGSQSFNRFMLVRTLQEPQVRVHHLLSPVTGHRLLQVLSDGHTTVQVPYSWSHRGNRSYTTVSSRPYSRCKASRTHNLQQLMNS